MQITTSITTQIMQSIMNFNLNHFILSTIAVILIINGSEVVAADTTQLRGNRSVDSQTLKHTLLRELGADDTNSTEFDDTNSTESYNYPSLDGTVISTFELVDDIEFSNDSLSSLPRPLCPDAATLTGGWLKGDCSSFVYPKTPDSLRRCEYGPHLDDLGYYLLACECDSQKGTDTDPVWMCMS